MTEQETILDLFNKIKNAKNDNIIIPRDTLMMLVTHYSNNIKIVTTALRVITQLLLHHEAIVKEHTSDKDLDILCGRGEK